MTEAMAQRKNIYSFLKDRGFVYQTTDDSAVERLLNDEKAVFYLGIDPTADSLHIGHFFALRVFRFLQEAGHQGILLIGGATSRIGDPSGKSDMRKMLDQSTISENLESIRNLVRNFIIVDGDNAAIFHSNAEWMSGYDYVDFLRDVGVHFNVNSMLQADAYKNRIKEGGLTFLEMGYMLMQAYDFVHLKREHGCRLQIGGSDQWGNIVAGTALNRKMFGIKSESDEIYGLTNPLLLTKDGRKMGKTEKGTLWVVGDRTPAFDFYQYFYNIEDESVDMLLRLFTEIDLKEISDLCRNDILKAKRRMAYEITALVHGAEQAKKTEEAAISLFSDKTRALADAPSCSVVIPDASLSIIDLMADIRFVPSKSEARRLIQQGAVSIDDVKVDSIDFALDPDDMRKKGSILIKRGKKNFIKVNFT